MILSGKEIQSEVRVGRITISPFDTRYIEPNSYGFHLGSKLLTYDDAILDCRALPNQREIEIPNSGYLLKPGRLYLGRTIETMGSPFYAATLYARRSTSTMGMWIQFSAPLGHTGSMTPWTLEITVVHPVIVYAEMLIGKLAFWKTLGVRHGYQGKYSQAIDVMASRLSLEHRAAQ